MHAEAPREGRASGRGIGPESGVLSDPRPEVAFDVFGRREGPAWAS